MMSYQFRRLLKTQAEILKEVRAQTVLLREIRDKDVKDETPTQSAEWWKARYRKEPVIPIPLKFTEEEILAARYSENWVGNFAETYRAFWEAQAPKPSCLDRLKKWWKKPESQEYRDNVDRIERLKRGS